MAEAFHGPNPNVAVTVNGPGTGDGFKLFCSADEAQRTDISDASRPIKDEEKQACATAGVQYTELKVAIDGLSVLTSPKNTSVSCLSFNDLYALLGPESQGFKNWKDAQALATELGSKTQLPDAPLVITAPGEESGTYDSFIEIALSKIATARGKDAKSLRPDYQSSGDDNVIIQGIAGNDTSLGFVGFAYAEENLDKVKLLAVDKGDGKCVEPTAATIASSEYPLARTLYIYVNKARVASNPALAAFVDFYLAEGTINKVLQSVPYVALTPDELAKSRQTWQASR